MHCQLSPQADIGEISVANNARICCSCARLIDVYLHYAGCLRVSGESGLAQTTKRGLIVMKSAIIKVAAVAAFTMLAGCQDLKPLQADVDNLKQQVSRLQADLAAAKSSADAANAAAQSASSTASGAQSAANQALAAAQASQSCCDATNEKIDRMFRRSISK
jgi:outer membrane murein-binding lipoprotein Lpp